MPVYVEETALTLDCVCINGGRRGYLVGISPRVLIDLLAAKAVSCAL
jgi:prolyl-tRNA editing enzyme YbaK/EbsC (Cys-tRNA(Pro) deacylase)